MEPSLALYIGVILPVCLALLINVIALSFIMRALTKKKAIKRNISKEERNQALHRLRIILIFCCIFSLTWLTGIVLLKERLNMFAAELFSEVEKFAP